MTTIDYIIGIIGLMVLPAVCSWLFAKLQLLEVDIMEVYYRTMDNEIVTEKQVAEALADRVADGSVDAETTIVDFVRDNGYELITDADVLAIAKALELDTDQITELIEKVESEDDVDFELAGARIIHRDFIDKIQQDELLSDLYCLGCFNANFLADYLPLDTEDIEQLQKAEAFTAIGKIAAKYIEEIQEGYAAADGYGHHFNGYDFSEVETDHYYVFPRAAE